jgi:hypothetical protein
MEINYKVWYILLTQLEDLVVFLLNKDMKVYWTTNDGRVMDVDDMSDTHVRNAFKMVLRKIQKLQAEEEELMVRHNDISLRGDMAMEFNNSMDDYEYDPYCKI